MTRERVTRTLVVFALCMLNACGDGRSAGQGSVIKFSGSALGAEGTLVARQIARFNGLHPDIHVELQRTPDDATQRHQLYVQWLNAGAGNPDTLMLDAIWRPEFAAAGWILSLSRFGPVRASVCAGRKEDD